MEEELVTEEERSEEELLEEEESEEELLEGSLNDGFDKAGEETR